MAAPTPKDQREYMSPYPSDLAGIKIVVKCADCRIGLCSRVENLKSCAVWTLVWTF